MSARKEIMPRLSFIALLALSAGALISAAAEKDAARVPVLLELFTSEGCSSCPPADHLLEILDQKQPVPGADLIVLSEHVDYWDRLGWRDPFSSPQYTARQHEYASKLSGDGVYTPQLVVDGRFGFVGSDGPEAVSAIQRAMRERKIAITISNIARDGNRITAHIDLPGPDQQARGGKVILYVAIAENKVESHVTRGENGGRDLTHVGVTRVLQQAGVIDLENTSSQDVTITLPARSVNACRFIAFIQDPRSGRVLGVTAQKL
jgi:hypothetical protein